MKNNRMERIDSEIQKNLASIISKFDDADFSNALISIMKVETFADLSMSKIYVSVLNSKDIDKTMQGLKESAVFIRSEIAKRINLRITPEFSFERDDSYEKGMRIDNILKDLKKD